MAGTFEGADNSDFLFEAGQKIIFQNARQYEQNAEFKAFLTAYEDKFDSKWNEQEVYARMDPIMTYQNTKRTINFSFDAPSYGTKEAMVNMDMAQIMIRSMYPTYNENASVATLSEAPIFKLSFGNLIQHPSGDEFIYGVIKSFSFKPKLEAGFFTEGGGGLFGGGASMFVPKTLQISCEFTVLHSHALGYNNSVFRGPGETYPYGTGRLSMTTAHTAKNYSDPNSAAASVAHGQASNMLGGDPNAADLEMSHTAPND